MAKLTGPQRKKMSLGDFALPSKKEGGKGGYPINDISHARNALARAAANASPAEQKTIKSAVHRKYPSVK